MSTTSAAPTTCPDLEDLAAFVDGELSGTERKTVVKHLASCEDCYEVYAETLRIQEDLGLLELPPGAEDSGGEAELAPVVVHPRAYAWVWKTGLAAVAAALLAVLGLSWFQREIRMPPVTELAAALGFPSDTPLEGKWSEHRLRTLRSGSSEPPPPVFLDKNKLRAAAFRLGVHVVDLEVALLSEDREAARESRDKAAKVLDALEWFPDLTETYRTITIELGEASLEEQLERTAGAEALLAQDPLLEAFFLDFGKWTEAARIAVLTDNSQYFQAAAFTRFLTRLKRRDLSERISKQLQVIEETLSKDGPAADLRTALEEIIWLEGVR